MGSDEMIVDLMVEYPPTIEQDNKEKILVKDSDMVSLPCNVDGVPSPIVKWYINDDLINDAEKYRISDNNSLIFGATINDIGNYTCTAVNDLGTAMTSTYVDVYVPITIERPDTTTIDQTLGSDVALPCAANGYPQPKIQWFIQGVEFTKAPINTRLSIEGTSLLISQVQIEDEGAYACTASNVGGTENHTYTVNVIEAPVIHNVYKTKTFDAVVADPDLRIQCNATGRPEPTISWIKDGSVITYDSDRYSKDEDGTLIINDIDRDVQGNYVCRAENNFGNDSVTYLVKVHDYPKFQYSQTITTKYIEDGSSVHIECPIPHESTDWIRWYKYTQVMLWGELKFNPITRKDAGYYMCRVTDDFESRSGLVIIEIGSKPVFTSEEKEEINDLLSPLVCEATGNPKPTIEWRHNGKALRQSNRKYTIETGIQSGKYECVVTNEFGSVSRTFVVKATDCVLDTENDFFTFKQPLMVSETPKWPLYDINKQGNMILKRNKVVHLFCPNEFDQTHSRHIAAFCVTGQTFDVKGKLMKYSEIECAQETLPEKKLSRKRCLGGNELWQIGFTVVIDFYPVYDVCINHDNLTLYTVHTLKPGLTRVSRDVSNRINQTVSSSDKLFECGNPPIENDYINSQWCFENRQLVSYRDLHPNIPVSASYDNTNLIPQWTSCNSNNWDEVEERVRALATASRDGLKVYTGAFERLELSDSSTVCLEDNRPVTQYMWKAVVDPATAASLAIIQVNVPDLMSEDDASTYVFCKDICHLTNWMNGTDWRDVTRGYVFCCNTREFDEVIKQNYNYKVGFRSRKTLLTANISP